MIISHVEGGLGNQMLDYMDFLAIKDTNPDQECYIETIVYNIKESHDVISMWNGYELEKVFGICEKNILNEVSIEIKKNIINDVKKSEFWENDWSISEAICNAFNNNSFRLENRCYDQVQHARGLISLMKKKISEDFFYTRVGYYIKKYAAHIINKKNEKRVHSELFPNINVDTYCGHTLKFMYNNYGIERLEDKARTIYQFPVIKDKENINIIDLIRSTNSIAIHARRGDFLSRNRSYYEYGYFKRATSYIKKRINNPVFFFFCDNESVEWVKQNIAVFGLSSDNDVFYFVDWNTGEKSYIDMQLMAECKHNIITNSSFGWWGAYLNVNENKITCSPDARINTTHHF